MHVGSLRYHWKGRREEQVISASEEDRCCTCSLKPCQVSFKRKSSEKNLSLSLPANQMASVTDQLLVPLVTRPQ